METSKEAAGAVGTRFEEVKRERQLLFQECYEHVSESLGVIYRDLTRSSKHPLGGNAYLTLDNTDEPYLGITLCLTFFLGFLVYYLFYYFVYIFL